MTRAVLINLSEGTRKTPRVLNYSTAATVKAELMTWIRQLSKAQRAGRPKRCCSLKSLEPWGKGFGNSEGLREDPAPVRQTEVPRSITAETAWTRQEQHGMHEARSWDRFLATHPHLSSPNSKFCTDVGVAENMSGF